MSTPRSHFDAVIVGAGVVGVASALWAQMRGQSVALIDPAPVGSGAISGNACTLATYVCPSTTRPSLPICPIICFQMTARLLCLGFTRCAILSG